MGEYKVYVHINKINGKRYYGITKREPRKRWGNGNGYRNNEYFWNSICKYGWDNFEHIVIAKELTEEEAKWLEIELIREWNTSNFEYGYNKSLGGEGSYGYKISEETRKKLRESHKGQVPWIKGKKHSEETKKKISEAGKGRIPPNKGKKASEEIRKRISNAKKGKCKGGNNSFAKSVYIIELNKEFETLSDCAEFLGCSISNISFTLSNKTKTCKGYHIIYAEYKDDINKINKIMSSRKLTTNQVYIVELNKEFNSIKECAEFLGCNTGSISNVLIGKRKTLYGYHIIYAEDKELEEK